MLKFKDVTFPCLRSLKHKFISSLPNNLKCMICLDMPQKEVTFSMSKMRLLFQWDTVETFAEI